MDGWRKRSDLHKNKLKWFGFLNDEQLVAQGIKRRRRHDMTGREKLIDVTH